MSNSKQYEAIANDVRFQLCMRQKSRMLWILMTAFLCYYFALLAGAAYYRPLFAQMLIGNLNLGMAFTLSQYLFAGAIALVYAQYMKKVDTTMQELIRNHHVN
jgi:uncharacterized membrane protein (DUF485 family)